MLPPPPWVKIVSIDILKVKHDKTKNLLKIATSDRFNRLFWFDSLQVYRDIGLGHIHYISV